MEKKANGIVLVCINEHPRSVLLLRAAKNKAKELNADWRVIYVADTYEPRNERNNYTLQNITLAEQMGAEVDHITDGNVFRGICNILDKYKENETKIHSIYVGDDGEHGILSKFRRTIGDKLKSHLRDSIKVEIIDLEGSKVVSSTSNTISKNLTSLSEFIIAILAVVVATAVVEILNNMIPHSVGPFNWSRPIVFMAACAFVAGKYGLIPGIVSALASYLVMNFFYVSPNINIFLNNEEDTVNLGLFLSATILIALFVGNTHERNDKLSLQMQRIQSLFKIYRASINQRSRIDVLEELHAELSKAFATEVIFFTPTPINPDKLISAYPKQAKLSESEEEALYECWNSSQVTGYGSISHPTINYRFIPLVTASNEIGVLAVRTDGKFILDVPTNSLLSLTSDHIAFILERIELGHVMEESRIRDEREKLRAMLLSSVSHDLKTPLASVIGALSVLRTMNDALTEEQKSTLMSTAHEEAQRLDSFITNILDMTRIETGQITFKPDWVSPEELVSGVTKRIKAKLSGNKLVMKKTRQLDAEIFLDSTMTSQAIQNILENAVKYSPENSKIEIDYSSDERGFILSFRDHGRGIPVESQNMIFDKYTRILQQDRKIAGTGLGLAISKLIMHGHKGMITVENHPKGGAIFSLIFPQWRNIKKLKD
jgi:two-component system sensor histidine kinase KdpD